MEIARRDIGCADPEYGPFFDLQQCFGCSKVRWVIPRRVEGDWSKCLGFSRRCVMSQQIAGQRSRSQHLLDKERVASMHKTLGE